MLNPHFATLIADVEWHAPVTIDAEVLHGLRKQWLVGRAGEEEIRGAFEILRTRTISRHPVLPLIDRMWAMRQNVTAYDASYVALAESLNVPLLTRDRRLANSSGHTARIEFLA